ncbi:hypothetical protein ACFWWC_15785 [Streptomyces sp. NPDC058642]|uniref:hypothetical protein n=1 Tax=Streptomyces sp. NPDC058642 TaxID=3346572 RepID=UPI003646AC85
MTHPDRPRQLLLGADTDLGGFRLPADLADRLREPGLEAAQALAQHLGPGWSVRYRDERHRTTKSVCWGCPRLHWAADPHETPPSPSHIVVEGEYKWYPLRAEGFDDFAPDDPAAALGLSEALVDDLYAWSQAVDAAMDTWLTDRDDAALDAAHDRLRDAGRELTERVAHEVGPERTVAYGGV